MNQPQGRYSEPDSRDWRGRSQFPTSGGDERNWDAIKDNRELISRYESRQQDSSQFNRQDQHSAQFARAQNSSNQVVIVS